LKLQKYQVTAIEVLTKVIDQAKPLDSETLQELQDLAIEALGEISELEDVKSSKTSFYNCECEDGIMICTDTD
jgi:hypothetical protein